ncbi:similar to Saccharomyces cerevisiae YBL032W HEK2 RNA binding protein involved in the asymmetric localization of ASH1 mRNA [Maudiozyma barnettii]|uniref:Similar to Saccharomyces cerevisiae YBL032W HEK2 RNA binding protein involved in the asymmetric localization of ASH1 mRNA n=1 Tax=Maudiozyma barnettii TaxID=61262 RepID=A0A8H2VD68_9SACH|nr:Hek2p [Kazachstania barnettii]CAB4253098.1 similar to Saccharomyces cerevisiae YBL032W HEK2 RNA binding protein involved in the asymmetric localization of ASH1 mRNA [Kazachstania barnettii]CAD1780367.1 similar to Saccharomyces cerevisiae YBL032W HEK2 RNA binding protein involved in the asymmetric localization of ASH1 mRNA [Kazachstania barnettii]
MENNHWIDKNHNNNIEDELFLEIRALISLDEASRIIGTKGSIISKVRDNNDVKIGISKMVPGCSDRILTSTGEIDHVSKSLGDLIEVLLLSYNNEKEQEENDVSIMQKKKFSFPFLNHILPLPSLNEIKDPLQLKNIGYIRLLLLNSQLSSIIGKQGIKIKSLIGKNGVKIVASKDFLPDSNERILEIQGLPKSITSTIKDIGKILIDDRETSDTNGLQGGKLYYPHLKTPIDNDEVKATVLVPENFVGAMLGKKGKRLNSLRKYTNTKIIAAKSTETKDDHVYFFTITGNTMKNVLMAESMLIKNLETEMQRRQDRLENEEAQ